MNKKGIILVISLVITAVLLILTRAYFSGLMTEKRSVDTERFILQALGLAEAGASHALAELNERMSTDLEYKVSEERNSLIFNNYVVNNDSLGFLRDFAYAAGDSQFTVSAGEARLTLSVLNLNTGVQGDYIATIIVKSNGDPTRPEPDFYVFPYNYLIESQGRVTQVTPNVSKSVRLLQGSFSLTVRRDNFARYALFTNHHTMPGGTTVWFTNRTNFTGPLHTNDRFSFANNPSGYFNETLTQKQEKARFYNLGSPLLLDADDNSPNDVPTFVKPFQRGQEEINLPSAISREELEDEALGGMSAPGPDGIYVPNNGAEVTGGIYVKGDSTVNMAVDVNNNSVYTITQGLTTKIVTVDYANNQTEVKTDLTTDTYQGIPDGISNEGIVIYADDDITDFSGTVQEDSSVLVSSEKDIVINNHIRYQNYTPDDPGTPLENELSAEGYNNLLGMISWNGNVRIGTSAPDNIDIFGVVMAPHGILTVDDYNLGSARGTATLLGGAITDFYGAFGTFSGAVQRSGYGRNFVYDARMLQGMAPAYFPYMANFTSDTNPSDAFSYKKLIWQDKGS